MQTTTGPTATRQRAPRLPAEERRKQILDAAVDVFARMGFGAAGTADIARAAGIGEPTIYRYFSNKRDLYVAAVRRSSDEILEAWSAIADESPDALTALQRIGVWYYQRLQSRPELLLLRNRSISESQDESIANAVRDQYRAVMQFVETLFRRAHADGQLAAEADVTTMTWLFMAVGSLLEQAQMLGLPELTPAQVVRIAAMIQPQPAER
jgi:AcrR family transcriptional regulator